MPGRPPAGAGRAVVDSVHEVTGLQRLDDGRHALADADAQRRDPVAGTAAPELPHEAGHQAGPRAAKRVAQRNRAAVDVEALLVDAETLRAGEHLRREGLIELDQ